MADPCPTCGHIPATRHTQRHTQLDDVVAFIRVHPDSCALDVQEALGITASASLPMLVARARLTRTRGASGSGRQGLVWRYSVVSRGSG